MSCKLISETVWQHDFRDDLESSIYILLWVMLMYSTCSRPDQVVPFLETVLDPQLHTAKQGGYTKADFLRGRMFLEEVQFIRRPAFNKLLRDLAVLFSCHYQKIVPDAELREPGSRGRQTDDALNESIVERLEGLKDHDATIDLFDVALRDRFKWPTGDNANDQGIRLRGTQSELIPMWNTSQNTGLL